jgi:hypothetical protein
LCCISEIDPLEKETYEGTDMTELRKVYWNAEIEELLAKQKKLSE